VFGDAEMTFRISAVAACCSAASASARLKSSFWIWASEFEELPKFFKHGVKSPVHFVSAARRAKPSPIPGYIRYLLTLEVRRN